MNIEYEYAALWASHGVIGVGWYRGEYSGNLRVVKVMVANNAEEVKTPGSLFNITSRDSHESILLASRVLSLAPFATSSMLRRSRGARRRPTERTQFRDADQAARRFRTVM